MGIGASSGRRVEREGTAVSPISRTSIVSRWKDFSQPVSEEELQFWSTEYRSRCIPHHLHTLIYLVGSRQGNTGSIDLPSPLTTVEIGSYLSVSKEEVKVVWNRFRMLHPDSLGCISRENFRRSPYSSNLFCKQIWFRMPSIEGDRDKIPFEVFLKSARWWQYSSMEKKIKLLFEWMSKDGVMTAELLGKVFQHSRPDLSESEVRDLSRKSIMYMKETTQTNEPEGEVSPIQGGRLEQFSKYILSFPEEELESALHFNMTEFDRV